jgi:N-acetylmuramoyl-L-alanine amidase
MPLARLSLLLIAATTLLVSSVTAQRERLRIEDLLWDSRSEYTRFIFELSGDAGEVQYHYDPFAQEPRVFYIDFYNLRPTYRPQTIPVGPGGQGDGLLQQIQIEHFPERNVVRFIFYVQRPALLGAVSIRPHGRHLIVDMLRREAPRPQIQEEEPAPQLTLRPGERHVVVIDPGHGGSSLGAEGIVRVAGRPVLEKNVALAISRRVAQRLSDTGVIDVRMTRTGDTDVSLSERVAMAQGWEGDLFVSIHANHPGNPRRFNVARGLELYYLSAAGEEDHAQGLLEGMGGEWRRNQEQAERVVQFQGNRMRFQSYVLCEWMRRSFQRDSYWAPQARGGEGHFRYTNGRNFHVLRNFDMPSALVEVGYMTHPDECRLLLDAGFQETVARNIADGIIAYLRSQAATQVGG